MKRATKATSALDMARALIAPPRRMNAQRWEVKALIAALESEQAKRAERDAKIRALLYDTMRYAGSRKQTLLKIVELLDGERTAPGSVCDGVNHRHINCAHTAR